MAGMIQCKEIEGMGRQKEKEFGRFHWRKASDSESEKDEEFEMLSDKGTKKVEEDNDITSSDEVGDSSPMK
ncbi:pinin, partial [Trichinella spiralis]|uniref:pinin n=1 Tax=Trichinella spiralis TaxID=6334 RepID=UPI0001EFEFAA